MSKNMSKYKIIKEDLKEQINTGKLKSNDLVLSESQLCEKYGVSRITVTRAINDLVSEGYLYRLQGKGTFVKGPQIKEGLPFLSAFTDRMKGNDYYLETKVLAKRSVDMPKKMSAYFNLPTDTKIIYLERLRIVNNEPLCISKSYLLPEIFYWTLLEDMEQESLYNLLEEKYNHKMGKSEQLIEIGYLDKTSANYMKITEKDPCLKFTLFCHLDDERPAQYEETYYLGNRYAYKVHLGTITTK